MTLTRALQATSGLGSHPATSDRENPTGDAGPPIARVLILDGPDVGREADAILQGPSGQLQLPDYRAGDDVLVEADVQPDGTASLSVIDRWRLPLLEILVAVFCVAVAAVAGWRGLRALASLALSLVVTLRLFIPLVVLGYDPAALAVFFGIVVTILTFMLTQGVNRTTIAASAGATLSLALTGVVAILVTALANFTQAQESEEVVSLQQITNGSIDLSGLLLAAVIFGGLGVLGDVAMTQAATVEELAMVDPSLSRARLFGRTMNVGIAHLGATINTLVFAYLGTALPLLVLLAIQVGSISSALNEEQVAVEIVRMIVGALGVVAAVPLTTAIAARAHRGQVSPPVTLRGPSLDSPTV